MGKQKSKKGFFTFIDKLLWDSIEVEVDLILKICNYFASENENSAPDFLLQCVYA